MKTHSAAVVCGAHALFAFVFAVLNGPVVSPARAQDPAALFDINDVSFLWPVPVTKADADKLISMDDKLADGVTALWPKDLFDLVINKAKTVSAGSGPAIAFDSKLLDPHVWKVAGIRVNPSALGASDAVLKGMKLPQVPGIRLIVQPVTVSGNKAVLHDFAAHVVYNFVLPGEIPAPDDVAFRPIVEQLKSIKKSVDHGITATAGVSLKIHPGFTGDPDGFAASLRSLLTTHLKPERFDVVSFMGIPGRFEPWIFFSVKIDPKNRKIDPRPVNGNFGPPNPPAIMLSFVDSPNVQPAQTPDAAAVRNGFGISTAPLFGIADVNTPDLLSPLVPGASPPPAGSPPFLPDLSKLKVRDAADYVANPLLHNTLTTDCVSCHTETTRRLTLALPPSAVAFRQPAGISGVDASVLHADRWNVRDFGWGFNFDKPPFGFHATVSQRAANEAAESADFINKRYLQVPPP